MLGQKAKDYLAAILKALDVPEVGKDISREEWREILEELKSAAVARLDALDDEEAEEEGFLDESCRYLTRKEGDEP